MGRLADQTWPFGRLRLFAVLIVAKCAAVRGDPDWIRKVPDGLELQTDEHCLVIASEWTVLINIDEPQPPLELIRFVDDLQMAVRRNSLLTEYSPWVAEQATDLTKNY